MYLTELQVFKLTPRPAANEALIRPLVLQHFFKTVADPQWLCDSANDGAAIITCQRECTHSLTHSLAHSVSRSLSWLLARSLSKYSNFS